MVAVKLNQVQLSRRYEFRQPASIMFPVSAKVIKDDLDSFDATIINYHYRGACLRLSTLAFKSVVKDIDSNGRVNNCYLEFYLGAKKIFSNVPFKLCWQEEASLTVGVEFFNQKVDFIARVPRFNISDKSQPKLSACDPVDPHRKIYFEVRDLSETGLLLETSLTNRHLFPGMTLVAARLDLPGIDSFKMDVFIENARPSSVSSGKFLLGASMKITDQKLFKESLRQYLTVFGDLDKEDYLLRLREAGLFSKKLKGLVTYKVVDTQEEYNKVLSLRFAAYGSHKKVLGSQTAQDMGPGLAEEGIILAGYIGNKIACAMELRFGKDKPPRLLALAKIDKIEGLDLSKVVEINKLTIDPLIQGSDIFIGLIQKAHAMVINQGNVDVLLYATKRLSKLYLGIGAEPLGIEFAHPYLQDETLTAMKVRRSTYEYSYQLDSEVWEKMYKLTNSYYADLGLVKIHSAPSKTFILENGSQEFVDPKLTKQEISASVLYPYILEADDQLGQEKVDKILARIGVPRSYVKKPTHWLSISFHDKLLDEYSAYGPIAELCIGAAKRGLRKDVMGVNYYILKHVLSAQEAFKIFSKLANKFNLSRTYELRKIGSDYAEVSIGVKAGHSLPKHAESCLNWSSSFESYLHLITGTKVDVDKTSCCYKGDTACSYLVKWQNKTPSFYYAFLGSILLGLLSYMMYMKEVPVFSILSTLTIYLIWTNIRLSTSLVKHKKDSSEEIEKILKESDVKYAQIQQTKEILDQRYKETRLIEKASQDILKNSNLHAILKSSLETVCEDFGFNRSFIMIRDAQASFLKTEMVAGVNTESQNLYSFKVDLSLKKNNPAVISSVYHTGQSIFINDPKAHIFQFNEESRQLIDKLQTKGFVMVQIPSSTKSWGVIVADKTDLSSMITRSDVVLLERLAGKIGLALDKQSQVEAEKSQKLLFQKYVPQLVLDQSSNLEPFLGGELKTIGVMFVDVRSFTAIAEKYSPKIVLQIINRFYTAVENAIKPHGGIIDKYLGDGVLVTWGTMKDFKSDANLIVEAVDLLFTEVEGANKDLNAMGLPSINIGLGAHIGEAIVGNVGTENRMEFTSLGSSINLASRLESLCKSYGTTAVLSEAFTEILTSKPNWILVDEVLVRGIETKQRIFIHK
jgi:class 3 adenylate cyclase